MPAAVKQFQPTPNPNALKCLLARPAGAGVRSFRTSADAAADPVAAALFAIPGVTSVLICDSPEPWLTVNKAPDAAWAPIKKGVEKALTALQVTDVGA